MYSADMVACRRILLYLLLIYINFSVIRASLLPTKFNITLKTPGNQSSSTVLPHKSVHVKYTRPDNDDQWTIIGFEPLIQTHYRAIQQLTVHLCDSPSYQEIWFDEETSCNGGRSMLIYEWTSYSLLTPFHIADDCGFQLDRSKSIVLTIIYKKERRAHKEQSGIMLYISNRSPKFQMGTILAGSKQGATHFSCRSSAFPRLLYGVKKLFSDNTNLWWRIYLIRVRQFKRKSVQFVLESPKLSNKSESNIEIVPLDLFLMNGDYILIQCEDNTRAHCYFLIYYIYKAKSKTNDNICNTNDYPDLFKIIPPREIRNANQTTATKDSSSKGSIIIATVCILLFVIWISIIIGCIIFRRIRGLVNFRTEPTIPNPNRKNKNLNHAARGHDGGHRGGDTDHIVQTDGDQAGH